MDPLNKIPILQKLTAQQQSDLLSQSKRYILSRGESLWQEGEELNALHLVLRGQFKTTKRQENDSDIILNLVHQGNPVCPNIACSLQAYCCTSKSMEDDSEVISIPRSCVSSLVQENYEFALEILSLTQAHMKELCHRISEVAGWRTKQRIALLFQRLALRSGKTLKDGGIRVNVPLTRQDIADLCGTTVETSIRVMSAWQKSHIISSKTRGFIIHDMHMIEAIIQDKKNKYMQAKAS